MEPSIAQFLMWFQAVELMQPLDSAKRMLSRCLPCSLVPVFLHQRSRWKFWFSLSVACHAGTNDGNYSNSWVNIQEDTPCDSVDSGLTEVLRVWFDGVPACWVFRTWAYLIPSFELCVCVCGCGCMWYLCASSLSVQSGITLPFRSLQRVFSLTCVCLI